MKGLKRLLCCLFWIAFVITAKAQTTDTSIYYQFIESSLKEPNSLAQIIIKNNKGQVLVVCKSLTFDIEEGIQIRAEKTKITLYLHQRNGQVDSIGPATADFIYDISRKTLFLEIPAQGNQPDFYTNSLHKVAIRAQKIEWKILQQQLYFDNKEAAICFTSKHHFDALLMEAYQSLGNTNPLVKMGLYVQKTGNLKAWFDLREMALLLDKRLDKVVLMDSVEVEKARKNPAFKIITNKQDFEQFKKGYPSVFKFAGMDVRNLKNLIKDSAIDEKFALPLYLKMVKDGFLNYNRNTKQIQLKEKLFHYVASMNRTSDYDYDHLKFWTEPVPNESLASRVCLDLKTQYLKVSNVKQVVLGSRQKVIARPSDLIYLLPNRSLKFNGQLTVGNTCFEGLNVQFEYKTYRVLLPQINRLNLAIYKRVRLKNEWDWKQTSIGRARAVNEKGEPTEEVELIKSVIEGAKGYLNIDTVTNKSGKNEAGFYTATFVSDLISRVYYDKCLVEKKLMYPRKSFYYELSPFQLNRINTLNIEQLLFQGKFYSSEIFPVFRNDLSLQFHDLSLGFDTLIIKADEVPVYLKEEAMGKGAFYGQLKLSNAGLIGNGILTYLGASLGCDVFCFLPEQVSAKQVDSFSLEASESFPKVRAKHIKMLWKPYENKMYLSSLFTEGFPFHFYYKNQKCRLDGQLIRSPKGLSGSGTLDWKQASMVSNPQGNYQIGADVLRSASVDVLLKIRGRHQFGFEQENVRLEMDFEQEIAHFSNQEANSRATFPYNAYETTFNEFDWDWKRNLLFMQSRNGQKGVFRKEGSQLEDLCFEAFQGIYDLNTGVLALKKLAPIKIGNAFLYLKDSTLEIEADGYIQNLSGKFIIGDTLNPRYILDAVELIWDVKTKSFISKGTSFELKTNEKSPIQLAKGKVEVLPIKEGLLVNYCWVFPNGDWCFFKWEKGVFSAISSRGAVDGILLGKVENFEAFRARWL
jgi:hypothetical protein